MSKKQTISFIGAGNLAYHLAISFWKKEVNIIQVYSRKLKNARLIADRVDSLATNNLDEIDSNADVYIIAVTDDAIQDVSKKLFDLGKLTSKLVVHTSGFTPSSILSNFENNGVIWPPQSFKKGEKVKFKKVPLCITANSEENLSKITTLFSRITKNISYVDDTQRAYLHVGAVFANNFSNHMLSIAEQLCADQNLDFDLLKPIIAETFEKIKKGSPGKMQTGPAARGDQKIIDEQIGMLKSYPEYQMVYKVVTNSILKSGNNEN